MHACTCSQGYFSDDEVFASFQTYFTVMSLCLLQRFSMFQVMMKFSQFSNLFDKTIRLDSVADSGTRQEQEDER